MGLDGVGDSGVIYNFKKTVKLQTNIFQMICKLKISYHPELVVSYGSGSVSTLIELLTSILPHSRCITLQN